jgi:hypothetical protein
MAARTIHDAIAQRAARVAACRFNRRDTGRFGRAACVAVVVGWFMMLSVLVATKT